MKRQPKSKVSDKTYPGSNPHDRFARKVLDDPVIAGDLLRHYTDPVIAKYVNLDKLDSLKPDPKEVFGKAFQELKKDISFAGHLIDKEGKSEVLVIAEHKSKPEPFVLLQLLVYLVLSWYKRWKDAGRPQSTKKFRLPMPILVVLYNGKENWEGGLDFTNLVGAVPPELEPFIPNPKVLFIRLNQFDKNNLPGKPETQAVVEAMIRATEGTLLAGLESVMGHFRDTSLDDRILELMEDVVHYCNWVEEVLPGEINKVINNVLKGQEGNMSQAVKEFRKSVTRIANEYAEAEGGAKMIIHQLSRRFRTVPKPVKDKVSSITDFDRLAILLDKSADCQSVAEFAKSLE
jgi:hypothetical protein